MEFISESQLNNLREFTNETHEVNWEMIPNETYDKQKLVKTFFYWDIALKMMLKPCSLILAAHAQGKIIKLNPNFVFPVLVANNFMDQLKGIYCLPNEAYLYLEFKTPTMVAMFQNSVKQIKNYDIHYINPIGKNEPILVSIDKLPIDLAEEWLEKKFEDYGIVSEIKPNVVKLENGMNFETTPVSFKLNLKEAIKIEDIPCFILIGQIKYFLRIRGKPNVCFRCLSPNHKSAICSWIKCRSCYGYVEPNHICKQSYASKVKINNHNIKEAISSFQNDAFPIAVGINENMEKSIIVNTQKGSLNNQNVKQSDDDKKKVDLMKESNCPSKDESFNDVDNSEGDSSSSNEQSPKMSINQSLKSKQRMSKRKRKQLRNIELGKDLGVMPIEPNDKEDIKKVYFLRNKSNFDFTSMSYDKDEEKNRIDNEGAVGIIGNWQEESEMFVESS